MQRQMPWMGEARRPEMAPMELITKCRNRLDAIRLCVQLSGMTHEYLAEQIGTNKGHWSRIMQGQAHFPTSRENDLMALCGNYAPIQWAAWSNGFDLQERAKDSRIAELEAQLAELRRSA